MDNLAAIDIGNSRLKLLYNNKFHAFRHNENSIESFRIFIDELKVKPELIAVSSVNSKILLDLILILRKYDIRFIDTKYLIESQTIINIEEVDGIGADRVFGLIGAINYSSPPLITVDCGTAFTINALNEQLKCLGGVIFPGPVTQSIALAEQTQALFTTNLKATDSIIADNTHEAINNGIIYSSVYSITRIVNDFKTQLGESQIILTGGAYKFIQALLDKQNIKYTYIQNLVLEGILSSLRDIH